MTDNDVAARRLAGADTKTRELVQQVQSVLTREPLDLADIKNSLITLLGYLCSSEGRTDPNCVAVDSFFMHDDRWVERNLPEGFHEIFADISGALHDTVSAPEIAENFESTPEQLLRRAKELCTEPAAPPDRR